LNPTAIYDVAATVLDCVCDAMNAQTGEAGVPDGYACPCFAYISAGEPAIDCCSAECAEGSDGMLTVHVEDVFPSDNFPVRALLFEPCKAATWVASVVVTAARCAPSMDKHGNPVPVGELSANALLMAVDQYAILTALGCCVVGDPPGIKRKRRVQISGSVPQVSEGGCASVEVRALIEIGNVCNCPEGS
jgi:hypothetical protein